MFQKQYWISVCATYKNALKKNKREKSDSYNVSENFNHPTKRNNISNTIVFQHPPERNKKYNVMLSSVAHM